MDLFRPNVTYLFILYLFISTISLVSGPYILYIVVFIIVILLLLLLLLLLILKF
jgi:hypothetical protein